jgi:hypothetical protein
MYGVKPGRGPSLMGGIGGIAVAVFGVFWTVMAASIGAPPFFALFGVVFVVLAIGGAVYNFYNATSPNRMSEFDVTSADEEPDPIATALGHDRASPSADSDQATVGRRKFPGEFCPFCGAKVNDDFEFCPKCGKDI